MTQYPNSDKLTDTAVLFEFSEWLGQKYGIIDLTSDEDIILNTQDLIYQFLGIDKAALEQERRAMVSDGRRGKRMKTFRVNQNGFAEWHEVEAESAQDAVEKKFGIEVYLFDQKGDTFIFDELWIEVERLYAAQEMKSERAAHHNPMMVVWQRSSAGPAEDSEASG